MPALAAPLQRTTVLPALAGVLATDIVLMLAPAWVGLLVLLEALR